MCVEVLFFKQKTAYEVRIRDWSSDVCSSDLEGAPQALARRIAGLALLAPVCDIVRIAATLQLPVEQVAEAYFKIGDRFGFDWLRRSAGSLPTDTAWDKLAVSALIDDFYGHPHDLTTRARKSVV